MIESEISSFVSSLLVERGLAKNTCESYGRDLALFAGFLRGRGVDCAARVSRGDIDAFLRSEREAGLSPATRRRRTAAIRSFLAWMKSRRAAESNPAELLDSPKKELRLPKTLSEAEVAAAIDGIKGDDPRSLRDRAMLEVLYGCGLRVSELCGMKVGDIVDSGELLRVAGKGSKERLVPIGSSAGRALDAYFASARGFFLQGRGAETHVFVTRLGRPFTRQGIFKIVKERTAAAGIAADRVSPHVFRHCFASHLLAHGADVRVIQELLGHADVGTTQIYTHVDAAKFKEIHRRCHPMAQDAL